MIGTLTRRPIKPATNTSVALGIKMSHWKKAIRIYFIS